MCEMGFVLDREGKKSFILLTFYQMQYALSYAQPFFHFLFLSFKAGFKRICVVGVLITAKLQF
jgi:hypothetical protein